MTSAVEDVSQIGRGLDDQFEPKDIFVSYARSDEEKLQPIVNAIAAAGASIWVDTEALNGAAMWGAEIVKAITAAKVVLVAASPAAFTSYNVMKEICLAHQKHKPILPIFLEPTLIPADVEYQLAGIHHINAFQGDLKKNLKAVLKALRQIGVSFRPLQQIETIPSVWVTPEQARCALRDGDGKGVKIAILDSGIESHASRTHRA